VYTTCALRSSHLLIPTSAYLFSVSTSVGFRSRRHHTQFDFSFLPTTITIRSSRLFFIYFITSSFSSDEPRWLGQRFCRSWMAPREFCSEGVGACCELRSSPHCLLMYHVYFDMAKHGIPLSLFNPSYFFLLHVVFWTKTLEKGGWISVYRLRGRAPPLQVLIFLLFLEVSGLAEQNANRDYCTD
jgi:hypothetical protein